MTILPYTEEHLAFRETARRFVEREIVPNHRQWERDGQVPRSLFRAAGSVGLLLTTVPTEYGGGGADFLFAHIVQEELGFAGATGPQFGLHSDIVAPYILHFGTDAQKRRWLPRMAAGETVAGIAMTEPGTGSDLAGIRTLAVPEADGWRLRGQKIFISNGQIADLFVVVAKTDASQGARGVSLFLVEGDRPGFGRGRNLEKAGMDAQDTSELFLDDVVVPAENLLGEAGRGFGYLMSELPQERLLVAITAVAAAEQAVRLTIEYVEERRAFGKAISEFQNTRFRLAECRTETSVARAFLEQCILKHLRGELGAEEASMAKWWCTEMQFRVTDACLQLFGGYGYMREYPIARLWADARVQRIYGGTTEIMKEIVARGLFRTR
jgi:acyl-CoA dehydrogenase